MNLTDLEQVAGYSFRDPSLLRTALTHPSRAGEGMQAHNQRMEFLGDAVLQLVMSERLYHGMPHEPEGTLSRVRARSVQESALCEGARSLKLGAYLYLGHGEEITGGRERRSILADAMEALLGAVYLDGGLEAARSLAERFLPTAADEFARDFKTDLQEKLQTGGGETPSYRIVSEDGPPHMRRFTAEVTWQGQQIGRGVGSSKKSAEQAAAMQALGQHHAN